jgi:hypothetical protein
MYENVSYTTLSQWYPFKVAELTFSQLAVMIFYSKILIVGCEGAPADRQPEHEPQVDRRTDRRGRIH